MKVPVSWLKDYVDVNVPIEVLAERLTLAGLEVEAIERIGDWWDRERIVVGEIREIRPHPNADRLVLADVYYGRPETEQCVTGAPNLFPFKGAGAVSLKVAYAMEGAELYDGHQEGFVKMRLRPAKIRGIPSRAMVCSEKELGISDEHEGIMFLPDDAPVGAPLADYLGDTILDLKLTPNLSRCLNMIGVAREAAALTGSRLRYPDTAWRTEGENASDLARVEIWDPDLCRRYIATIIRGVTAEPAPRWMQDRLRKGDMRPISNIVDITNFVMLEWGQPLHAFDYDKLVARAGGAVPTIIVRRTRPGDSMTTLDGVYRTFAEDTLLICDTAGPIAVAGVMGGVETEIDAGTRSILLESANFDLISVRRTSQALKLPSEASLRFGRGIHPALTQPAARRASELMRVLAGGSIARGMVDAYPRPAEPTVIELATAEVERTLGFRFSSEEIVSSLERLEFQCSPIGDGSIRVVVPEHRIDCAWPADLIEEVARVYGYDRIPVAELADRLPPQRANRGLELEEKLRDILVGCGLQEAVTYSLTNLAREAGLVAGGTGEGLPPDSFVSITNTITQERSIMRRHLLATLLETAAVNLRFRDRVSLFEAGKVFLPRTTGELPDEPRHLAIVMSGPREDRHWLSGDGSDCDYFDLKGIVQKLLDHLHISDPVYEPVEHPAFQPGRTARLRLGDVEIGVLGEIRSAVREAFELPERRVAAAELDLEALLPNVPPKWLVEPISPYPAVLQDLAFVVSEQAPAADMQKAILETGGSLLREVSLFDLYRGDPIGAGKKSLAFALTFQAPDRTLTDDQVARHVKRIVDRLARDFEAELRG